MNDIYKIYRWDAVIFPGKGINPIPTPIVYIKPDERLINFVNDNSNALLIKLNIPNSIYNDRKVIGMLYKSSEIPNCRPVFFEKTKLYVIALQAPWHGYPDFLGDIEVFGLTNGFTVEKKINTVQPTRPYKQLPLHSQPSQPSQPSTSQKSISISSPSTPPLLSNEKYKGDKCKSYNIPATGIFGIFMIFLVLFFVVVLISKKNSI